MILVTEFLNSYTVYSPPPQRKILDAPMCILPHGRMVSKPKVQEFFNFYWNNFSIPSTSYVIAKLTLIMAIRSLLLYGWWFTHHRLPPVQLTTMQTRSCGLLYITIPTQTPLWQQHWKPATRSTSIEFCRHHPQPLHFSTTAGHTQDAPQQTWRFYTHKMWYLLRMAHNGWSMYRLEWRL